MTLIDIRYIYKTQYNYSFLVSTYLILNLGILLYNLLI